ncbi:MAG: class II lanthipeptide, LchA2/BrtA2 family [Corynebacterium sp.]|uniref:class II lanthipeptide, LchA2/BrtA2 family n=1 Tax=Corynebacterium sp. TaxID=1720 RepID=UPI0026DD83CF|nr:class II lanthipeptide, LchA2/BrtA2 family [Corynebacterium sp.]MDO5098788.1 class II lanthipeptide, LchA2/BrtA2 family [Corynebacterium sp.]
MAKKDFGFVEGYAREDLREMIDNEQAQHGGTWTTIVPVSLALCPTTKCSKRCS